MEANPESGSVQSDRVKPDPPAFLGWGPDSRFGFPRPFSFGPASRLEEELRAELKQVADEKTELYALLRVATGRANELASQIAGARDTNFNSLVRISLLEEQNKALASELKVLKSADQRKRSREARELLNKIQAVVAESQKKPRGDDDQE